MLNKLSIITLVILAYAPIAAAQSTYVPLWHPTYHLLDRLEIKSDSLDTYIHTSTKPYTRFSSVLYAEAADEMENANFTSLDRQHQYYVYKDNSEWTDWGLIESKRPVWKHFYKYQSDFFYIKDYSDFLIKINPVFSFQLAKELEEDGLKFTNTKGIAIRGMIGQKVGFSSLLTDNQVSHASYVYNRIFRDNAVPYEGRFKNFTSSVGDNLFSPGVDYLSARGYITFQPIERIGIQFGHDQNFIGNGIRSLFLSNFSNNHFFLKVNTKVWKLNYQNLFMELTNQFNSGIDQLLPKKYAVMHHLSFNATQWLNIGLFESVVFGRENHFELQYLNPLIFYRAVEFQLGSPDNVLVGLDYKVNFLQHFSLYGQLVLDEFKFSELKEQTGWWANKYGVQIGLKYVDIASISNLDAQIEYNTVRPYTYSHHTATGNYSHYNAPLAHPLGANFREVLGVVRYKPNQKIQLKMSLLYAEQGLDSDSTNWGSNIFLPNTTREQEYNNDLLQGEKATTYLADFLLSYQPKHNLFLDAMYTYRKREQANVTTPDTHFLGLGMRLNIGRPEFIY